MSKKSDTKPTQEKTMKHCYTNDFSVKKYRLDPIKDFKSTGEQKNKYEGTGSTMNAFPRYVYDSKGDNEIGERMIVITQPIKILKGGLPKKDGKFRKTDNQCMYFWLPLDQCKGGKDLDEKVLRPLDEFNDKKINEEKNESKFVAKLGAEGKLVPLKKLKYLQCAKYFDPTQYGGDDGDDNDDNNDDNKKKYSGDKSDGYRRVKVRLATLFDDNSKPDDDHVIKTLVHINDENGNPKKKAEEISSLEDLRKLFRWKCTAQFALEFNKFWIMKSESDSVRKCGIGVKCLEMHISEIPEYSGTSSELGIGVFGFGQDQKPSNKSSDESDDSDSSDSDDDKSEKVSAKEQKKTATKQESSEDSDSSDDNSDDKSDEESEDVQPTKKSVAKSKTK